MRSNGFIANAVSAIVLLASGAGATAFYHSMSLPVKPVEAKAKIVGPDKIHVAGELALFRASVPGKSPKDLIYTWGVEPLTIATYKPELLTTVNADEIQVTTVAGKWRLWCSITDPSSRTGQMLSRQIEVPGGTDSPLPVPPEPSPPAPTPAPNPTPPAPLPTPTPANRFSDLTADVHTWLADVASPNKAAEAAALRNGATAIVERLRTGDLSTQTGMTLEMNVVRAVQASNSDAIKTNAAAWKGFASKVGTYAGSALAAKRLAVAADWADMLAAFAAGLN